MDSAMVRYRYASKRPFSARRRRKAPRQGNRLRRLIMFQSMACVVLLLFIVIARSVNIAAANFITSQVKYILQRDIEIKSIFSSTESFVAGIRNKIAPDRVSGELTVSGGADDLGGIHDPDGEAGGPDGVRDPDRTRVESSGPSMASVSGMPSVSGRSDPWNANVPFEGDKNVNTGKDEAGEADGTGAFSETSVLSANSVDDTESMPDMLKPVEGTLATPFGETRDAALGNVKMHAGIDIDTEPGGDVKAVLDGEITRTGLSPEYGGYVEIQHYNGLRTVYANCGEIIVNEGAIVKRGDVIARTCNGGILTGSHLHFEVWDGEYAMDPLDFISVPAK